MKGLDTNVLVRYLVKDDKVQAQKASACINALVVSDERCFISGIVLCELVWVLESAYNYSKAEISGVLEKLIITKQFEIESKDIIRQAVFDYKTGSGDFTDYFLGRMNHSAGCDVTYTFDRTLKNSPLFLLL